MLLRKGKEKKHIQQWKTTDNGGVIMANVKRIYVEKKEDFAVKAKELKEEVVSYLGITGISQVRVLIRY